LDKIDKLKKFWNNKKVFVTGHTGFKGSWFIIILKLLGAKVYGYSLKPKKKSLFNKINAQDLLEKNYYGDINDLGNLKKKIKVCKPKIIFHLAAQALVIDSHKDPIKTFRTNILGTCNVLETIKSISSIKSAVIVTTDKVYKEKKSKFLFSEEDELGGKDPYSASKVCAEILLNSYILSFFKNSHLKNSVSSARSGNVVGGGDYSKNRLIPDIFFSIKSKTKLKIRNPKHVRPWQHVIEPLIGYILLAQKQMKKNINKIPNWNFGPEKNNFVSVIEIVNMINKNSNFKTKTQKQNNFLETKILKLNSKKSKKILNWKPKWNIKKTIEKVVEWNIMESKKFNARKICELQVRKYLQD